MKTTLAPVLMALGILAFVFLLYGLMRFTSREKLRKRGVRIPAKCITLASGISSREPTVRIFFEPPDHEPVSFETTGNPRAWIDDRGNTHPYPDGGTEVVYDPVNPQRAEITHRLPKNGRTEGVLLTSGLAVSLAAIAGAAVIFAA